MENTMVQKHHIIFQNIIKMNKIVPYNIDYIAIKKVDFLATLVLCISAALSLVIIAIDRVPDLTIKDGLNYFASATFCGFSILYFILDIIQNYLFQLAESNRKNDFIDNSLNTKLADKNSHGYFSNDNVPPGIYKLGINCFENTFFTKSISGKMITAKVVVMILIILLYLAVAFLADQRVLIAVLQMALPITIFQQTIRLIIFHSSIKSIFVKFKLIFASASLDKRDSLLLDNVINYERALAWASIQLDEKLFSKNNMALAQEWEEIKKQHGLV